MADSEAVRSRRKRLHRAGDHRLCLPRNCPSAAGEPPAKDRAGQQAGGAPEDPLHQLAHSASIADPVAELRQLAAQLAEAYRADPGNALLARELRMTLQALVPQKAGNTDDDLSDLFAEFGGS